MDSPLVIVWRLTVMFALGVVLPQLLGLAARGLGHRPNHVRIAVGTLMPAFTFFAVATIFVKMVASTEVAETGHAACGGFGAAAFGLMLGGPVCHALLASILQPVAAETFGR